MSSAAAAPKFTSTSIAATPGVLDSSCDHGRAVDFSAPRSWLAGAPSAVAAVLPDGITLVAISSGNPASSEFLVRAFTKDCAPDIEFAGGGVDRIKPEVTHHLLQQVSIWAMTPALGGGMLVAGQDASGWLVGQIRADGAVDSSFGTSGWTQLAISGNAEAILQEPSGAILVGGADGGGCCVREWVAELTANGLVQDNFGSGGETRIPVLEDSAVEKLAVEPDGEILALTGGGNMGCWSMTVSALTPAGKLLASFASNFARSLNDALPTTSVNGFRAFVGDMIARPPGFLLIGASQPTCVGNRQDPAATGRVVAFGATGTIDTQFDHRGTDTFTFAMDQAASVYPRADGGYLVFSSPVVFQESDDARAVVDLVGLTKNGHPDPTYGRAGHAQVVLPYSAQAYLSSVIGVITAQDGRSVEVISSTASGKGLMLFRVLT